MDTLLAVGIFIATLFVIEGGYFSFKSIRNPEIKKVRRRLRMLSFSEYDRGTVDILRRRSFSKFPWLDRGLSRFRWAHNADRLLEQADAQYTLDAFLLLSISLALAGLLGGSLVTSNGLLSICGVASLGMTPFLHVYTKKRRRMLKFQRQLPEAVELIARALKAGHAFSGGVKMVADEVDDPIGTEFAKTLGEINFGVGATEALRNLSHRVDCPDLKFFVISVIIQRETGGNLAEILENIGYLIRERFKLQGRVRALSAEGKLSAIILVALPFLLALAISFLNPGYIETLSADPIGKGMVVFAIFMMITGVVVMKKMIEIRV